MVYLLPMMPTMADMPVVVISDCPALLCLSLLPAGTSGNEPWTNAFYFPCPHQIESFSSQWGLGYLTPSRHGSGSSRLLKLGYFT
jgi:hypothetical protein